MQEKEYPPQNSALNSQIHFILTYPHHDQVEASNEHSKILKITFSSFQFLFSISFSSLSFGK